MTDPLFVPIVRRGKVIDYAWVDAADAELVAPYRWIRCGIHAVCGARLNYRVPARSGEAMHRFLLGLKPFEGVVHHLNEDPLDNRRSNLQICATMFEHGTQPHPRRDRSAGPYRQENPPHERELAILRRAGEVAA